MQANNMNFEYKGPLYMGTALQPVEVVWDTGSDWLVVGDSTQCDICDLDAYDTSKSSTFEAIPDSDYSLLYGSAYASGYLANDNICTLPNRASCTNMKWFALTSGYGFEGIDGIVGMSTGYGPFTEGPILVQELYKDELIENPIFGFYLTGVDGQSYLDIGRFQDGAVRNQSEMVWLKVVEDDFWWTNYITGIKFTKANRGIAYEYRLDSNKAMTDSGTSCVYMPNIIYDAVLNNIREMSMNRDNVEISWDGEILIDCKDVSELPIIEILYGGYWMEMLPEDYIVEYEGYCFACLGKADYGEEWILGDAFMRGFYSTHDHKSQKFGFAPHAESTKRAPYEGEQPANPLTKISGGTTTPSRPRRPINTNSDEDGMTTSVRAFHLFIAFAIFLIIIGLISRNTKKTPNEGLKVIILKN